MVTDGDIDEELMRYRKSDNLAAQLPLRHQGLGFHIIQSRIAAEADTIADERNQCIESYNALRVTK